MPHEPDKNERVIIGWEKMAVNRRKKNIKPKIPFVGDLLKEGQWKGRPCVVLGGGPSLESVVGRLDEFPDHTEFAAPNQGWRLDPAPSVIYAIDKQVFDLAENGEYKERWAALASKQVRVTNQPSACKGKWLGACWITQISHQEWGRTFKEGIVAANNTGLGLINIVDILGADPIVLLGYDGKHEGGRLNWHDDYPDESGWKPKQPEKIYERWKKNFSAVAPKIKSTVVNANPKSTYGMFKKCTFEEAVELCHTKVTT